jgi:Domain of unknown function (DUF5615)
LDENVPAQVADELHALGYFVLKFHDVLAPGVADTVVCAAALLNTAILVSIDGDMKAYAKKYGSKQNEDRFSKLCLLHLQLPEPQAAGRIAQAASLIQHEWNFVQQLPSRRLWMVIAQHQITTYR